MSRLVQNPLYVLELDRRCTAMEVERAAKRVLSMLSLGFDGADRYDTPFGPRPRDVELVRWAATELRDPERRARHAATAIRAEAPPEDRQAPWPDALPAMGWGPR